MNEYIATCDTWGKEQINKRGEILAEHALKIWIRPEQLSKPNKTKDFPQKAKQKNNAYPIEHYFENKKRNSRRLYEELKTKITQLAELEQLGKVDDKKDAKHTIALEIIGRGEILSVDPCKDYLNLFFYADTSKLDDPKGKAKKMVAKHLGNGDAKIKLESLEDIPYCIDLIKQALAQNKSKGGEQAKHNQTPKI